MPPQDDSPYPRHGQKRSAAGLWWAVLAGLLACAAAAYYWWPAKQPAPPPAPRLESPKKAAPAPEPAIRYPLELGQPAPPAKPLPGLEESDTPFRDELAALLGGKGIAELLRPEKLVRNIVATVDSLPRAAAPSRVMPLNPTPGAFAVLGKGDDAAIGPGNAARYASRLRLLQSVDARRLVDLYLLYYPLFQKAYVELGYPGRYFNDRLIEALDDLLAAPEIMTPPKLQRPKVLWLYADPELEGRSAGQKIMLRIGAGNQGLAKAKLREIRREILSRTRTPEK